MIQDLSGSWCFKGPGESTLFIDSLVPLMHHDPDRSWITDPDADHPKGWQPQPFKEGQHIQVTQGEVDVYSKQVAH